MATIIQLRDPGDGRTILLESTPNTDTSQRKRRQLEFVVLLATFLFAFGLGA